MIKIRMNTDLLFSGRIRITESEGSMDYKRKYKMTKEANIEIAREHIDELVGASLVLEGCASDEADYRAAWEMLLDTINQPLNSKYIRNIHQVLGKTTVKDAGKLRCERVEYEKAAWVAHIPNPAKLDVDLRDMTAIRNTLDRSLYITTYLLRMLPFKGANKVLALLIGNKIMIESGQGIILVPEKLADEFEKKLKDFYQTRDVKMLKDYIYEKCILGFEK